MIRGRTKPVNVVKRQSNIDIHNRFDIEVIDSKTDKVKQTAKAYNLLCDTIWKYLCGGSAGYAKYIAYGSGSGTPAPSDTNLFAGQKIAQAREHASGIDYIRGTAYRTIKITLDETTDVGKTITEVGVSPSGSSGYLCSHAMLQDMNGNPISITKTNTDIINIYATLYAHWKPDGYNGVYMPCSNMTSTFLGVLLGSGYASSKYLYWGKGGSANDAIYVGNSFSSNVSARTCTMKYPRIDTTMWNYGGFGWITHGWGIGDTSFIVDVRGVYPVYGEAVGTGDGKTTAFATKFDLPMNAIVYIDGKIASGVTVKKEPLTLHPDDYMVIIASELTADGHYIPIPQDNALNSDRYTYMYNTVHDVGVYSWSRNSSSVNPMLIAFSDDMVNWSSEYSQNTTIPEQHRCMKYLRARATGYTSLGNHTMSFPPEVTGKQIVFDTPPAAGSVITIDYETPFVPKDENHVYDFTLTIQFGEHDGS